MPLLVLCPIMEIVAGPIAMFDYSFFFAEGKEAGLLLVTFCGCTLSFQ